MKKIMLALAFLLSLSTMTFAQTKPAQKKGGKPVAARSAAPAVPKAESASAVAPVTVQPAAKTGTQLKKDGTPDKRFKENKATVHQKKDGSPDKRFKENKKKS